MKRLLVLTGLLVIGCCLLLIGARQIGQAVEYPFSLSHRRPIPLAPPYHSDQLLPTVFADTIAENYADLHSGNGDWIIAGNTTYVTKLANKYVLTLGLVLHDSEKNAVGTLRYNAAIMHNLVMSHVYFVESGNSSYLLFSGALQGVPPLCMLQYINNQRWVITVQAANCQILLDFMRDYPF